MKSVQITYDAKVKIGTSYERGEACTQVCDLIRNFSNDMNHLDRIVNKDSPLKFVEIGQ